ncbi:MAG: AhpC/TSA family protein [Candidatus Hydrogenedentota bacterium]|nr:MAG: AhpC/TSA family protein [Candidatus Hydrogenedentota bacterium]
MKKLKVGNKIPEFQAELAYNKWISSEDLKGNWTHLAFHRYAGCPICNLSIRQFQARIGEIQQAGIRHISIFHSPAEKMQKYYPVLPPFEIILDPMENLYKKFGVEGSLLGYLSPKSALNLAQSLTTDFKKGYDPDGTATTMPADFLVNPDGVIVECHYGEFIGDSWTVDDVIGKTAIRRNAVSLKSN